MDSSSGAGPPTGKACRGGKNDRAAAAAAAAAARADRAVLAQGDSTRPRCGTALALAASPASKAMTEAKTPDSKRADKPQPRPEAFAPAATGARSPSPVEAFAEVRVKAVVVLPPSTLTLDQIARLEPGTVVRLDTGPGDAAEVLVNGMSLAEGQVVSIGGRRAMVVTEVR
jgi:flagellar motor switch/type III secretory pathway protein FliN